MSFMVPAADNFSKITAYHNQLFCPNVGLPNYTRIVGFKCCGSKIEPKHLIKSNKTKKLKS